MSLISTVVVRSTSISLPLKVIEPPTFTVAKNDRVASTVVPGMSNASDKYCRELIGSVSIFNKERSGRPQLAASAFDQVLSGLNVPK